MPSALDDLITLLDLEVVEVNIFRGLSPQENRQRVFGGQVAGQALVAAARTVDDKSRRVHSLHAYFCDREIQAFQFFMKSTEFETAKVSPPDE